MIAPTLIIGLGGTGSEIVSKIEEEYRNSNELNRICNFYTGCK